MLRLFGVSTVVAALLALSAVPALAGGSGKLLPIHGAVIGAGGPDMTAPGCEPDPGLIWRFNTVGTGELSRLGSVGYVLTHCTYMQPDGSFAFRDGTITFTADNGDLLVIAQEGVAVGVIDPDTFEMVGYTAEGTWTVVGGTGRFTSATGSGWIDVVGDIPGGDALFGLPDGFDRWAFGGRIAYDASDRSR